MGKCRFATSPIHYHGYIIDRHGRRHDLKKIEAITKMPAPKDISQLRSFLGLMSYYGSFIREMRSLRAPLDALLVKNAKFNWTKECNDSFNRAKAILSSDLHLAHYDPSHEIIVAADASNYGLGAVISHRYKNGSEKAVAHASRSLLPAEKNYSQVEKGGLALYRSTEDFGQADALSRLIANHSALEKDRVIGVISADEDIRLTFANAVQALPVTADEVKEWTAKDLLLQQVNDYIRGTWPTKITNSDSLCF
ncbi:hypothetical protein TELCIR_02324 [Teladorsagia circumcincta]|uniref:RNA-directed DNA polymerase n=1 Tax=Teladorsagia circumcincta TaxID=45464 RepID=A0A2G9UZE6_TELCI|nr:hypothetical protein TELCIR_02324 [Teladorsagia circumcincta]